MNRWPIWGALLWQLCSGPVLADDLCRQSCDGDMACELKAGECLLSAQRAPEAIQRFKTLQAAQPQTVAISQFLAKAYLADGNAFWALRVLQRAAAGGDVCASGSWLAWVHIGQGNLDLAQEALAQTDCPLNSVEQARRLLLLAYLARLQGQKKELTEHLESMAGHSQIYAEDQDLWRSLRRSHDPGHVEPVHLRVETALGYTGNARAGSPTDKSTEAVGSALARVDLFGRFIWPLSSGLQPMLEGHLKGHGLGAEAARNLSYLDLSARPGLVWIGAGMRGVLAYKADYLLVHQDLESQRRFYEGHRAEADLEWGRLTFFAGGGRRIFHEGGRSRWEFDGGLGGGLSLRPGMHLLLAGSARVYDAVGDVYDLAGGSGLAVLRTMLPGALSLRLGLTLSLDHYLHSGGERGQIAFGSQDKRRDLLVKASTGLWSPSWFGAKAGIAYEYSWRDSTIGEDNSTASYGYQEHRVLMKLRWRINFDPWAPALLRPEDHVRLDYGLGGQAGDGLGEERIQDLLRQDEAARRGSSCVD